MMYSIPRRMLFCMASSVYSKPLQLWLHRPTALFTRQYTYIKSTSLQHLRISMNKKDAIFTQQRCSTSSDKKRADDLKKFENHFLTVPNFLCLFRIAATPVAFYLVVNESYASALLIFVLAGVTDLLDGYIARNFAGQASLLGSVIDPLADKLLLTALFVALAYVHLIPAALTTVVLTRDAGLIIGTLIRRYKTMERPVSLTRVLNPKVSPMKVMPTNVSKLNTALQMATIVAGLSAPLFGFTDHQLMTCLYFATAFTTIYSGMQYVFLTRIKNS